MPKAKFILSCLIVIAIGSVAYFYRPLIDYGNFRKAREVAGGPAIEASPASYDFGKVVYGEISKKEFTIKNTGNENLEILKISTSCGCTKAEMNNGVKIIFPGESSGMTVSMNPAIHGNYSDMGEIKRVVYVKTNDKNIPEKEIEISANVIKPESNATYEIKNENGKFDPVEIKTKKNTYVELKFAKPDSKYDFRMDEYNIAKTIDAGDESQSVVFKADKKGSFRFYDGGNSEGKLIVE
ncbi:MAG: DUF1573 domain-containing protein [Candidatus Paceibacterota bacterium]|jgi:hypothetical protein